MLGVPNSNIFEIENATEKDLEKFQADFIENWRIYKRYIRNLDEKTGICGTEEFDEGFLWQRTKIRAMKEPWTNDYIIVSLLIR